MSFAVIESSAGFTSAAAELLPAVPELVFRLVGALVHATAKLSATANETIAWIRCFILMVLDSVVGFNRMFLCRNAGTSQTQTCRWWFSDLVLALLVGPS